MGADGMGSGSGFDLGTRGSRCADLGASALEMVASDFLVTRVDALGG